MKRILDFFGSRLLQGFLIMLPFLLAYILMGGFVDLIVMLLQPVRDLIPTSVIPETWVRRLTALGFMVIFLFIIGVIGRTKIAQKFGSWIESKTLMRFPPYELFKNITSQSLGETTKGMQPALVKLGPGVKTIAFIAEELERDMTIYIPMTSLPTVGQLQLVAKENVEKLDVAFMDALGWYFNWGTGTSAVLTPSNKSIESK